MEDLHYYELLAKTYPSIQDAAAEIINLKAILHLPKGTEHFLSDIHGEYDAFAHMIKSGSGVIKDKIEENFPNYSKEEKDLLATLIYYPKHKLDVLAKEGKLTDDFYRRTISDIIEIAKITTSKYTISKVRKAIDPKFSYIIEELLQSHSYTFNKEDYYYSIITNIINTGIADSLIIEIAYLIQKLSVDHLHVLGDIYDRGEGAYRCMDFIMRQKSVDICFGNHDVVYIGAAAGDQACIANVIRTSCRYNHLNTIEDGYGISLRPLVTFALKHYQNDPCIEFIPSDEEANDVEDYDTSVIAKMHKAITIILFKLEAKIIDKHLEYKGEYLKKLDKVDFEKGEYVVNGHRYKLIDNSFPTVDPNDVYKLTKEEQELMDKLTLSFRHCDRLQRHIDFLFSHGSMYLDYNYNLLFHGCIPTLDDGSFQTFITKDNKIIKGKEYLDYLDKEMRKAYYSKKIDKDTSIFYFLWCFSSSPLYGKNDITTFERYFLNKEDRKAFKEEKNAYYKYVEDEEYCKKVLHEFNIDKERSIIINGHMPVNVKNGESPIKANGKYIVIDGGLSKAYHNVTGIAGYTLVFNSYGFKLIAHDVFKSKEDAIKNNTDIAHEKQRIVAFSDKRIPVEQTYIGNTIKERIEDLTTLLHLYQEGIIKSK